MLRIDVRPDGRAGPGKIALLLASQSQLRRT
jgi:hypothetical protein